jgi:hypothetical protein
MQQPSTGADMTQNYLYLQYPNIPDTGSNKVPWVPLQADIFSADWHVVE